MKDSIKILCPAKINLFLEVIGKRPDGYHEVYTVMQTVDLYDEIVISGRAGGVGMKCDRADLPSDRGNLCRRAAEALMRETGVRRGININLRKRIPIAAGLGGGSSDAAGVLLALNAWWGLDLPLVDLGRIASELGSDVPFFLTGGAAACSGRGEIITPIENAASYAVVLAAPPIPVATPEVYRSLSGRRSNAHGDGADIPAVMESGDPNELAGKLYNRLEENPGSYMDEVNRLKGLLVESGAIAALMSGSGAAVFGIAENAGMARMIGERMKKATGGGCFIHWGVTGVKVGPPGPGGYAPQK